MSPSFTREPDPNDEELREDRFRRAMPWSKSPFSPEVQQHHENSADKARPLHTLVLKPSAFSWTDLMLDLAMATAFANLTTNTKILSGLNAASYVSFFALVFWIWASIVAYNVRYRQEDWLHRLYAFCQLCVFGVLSAFTSDFDISNGIRDNPDDAALSAAQAQVGASAATMAADKARRDRLPTLNGEGISLVLAVSRLLLLVSYITVFYHARRRRNLSLSIPIITTSISTVMYFAAFGLVSSGRSGIDVTKVVLWFLPLLIESGGLFVESYLNDNVGYQNGEAIWERYSTMLTVIIGEGLNGITGAFRFVIASVGFDGSSAGAIVSTGVIVFMLWTLYFESAYDLLPGSHRALSWSMLHFLFFSALILLLEAMENILLTNNLSTAVILFNTRIGQYMESGDPKDLVALNTTLAKLGISLADELETNQNDTNPEGQLNQWQAQVIYTIFQQFDALPEVSSASMLKFGAFIGADSNDTLVMNEGASDDFAIDFLLPRVQSAKWFCGCGGAVLMFLALLNYVQRPPTDKYGWGSILSRFFSGFIFTMLSILNIGGGTPFTENRSAPLWAFMNFGFMLPAFAILLLLQGAVDYVLLYLSTRAYRRIPTREFDDPSTRPGSVEKNPLSLEF